MVIVEEVGFKTGFSQKEVGHYLSIKIKKAGRDFLDLFSFKDVYLLLELLVIRIINLCILYFK